ncbi:hypothetical protein BDF14DRAFT_1836582 [Spinellus fusiger]|nr:hypothetical protein BDF14DRAFT_1836582 [Spinellus fusiger]
MTDTNKFMMSTEYLSDFALSSFVDKAEMADTSPHTYSGTLEDLSITHRPPVNDLISNNALFPNYTTSSSLGVSKDASSITSTPLLSSNAMTVHTYPHLFHTYPSLRSTHSSPETPLPFLSCPSPPFLPASIQPTSVPLSIAHFLPCSPTSNASPSSYPPSSHSSYPSTQGETKKSSMSTGYGVTPPSKEHYEPPVMEMGRRKRQYLVETHPPDTRSDAPVSLSTLSLPCRLEDPHPPSWQQEMEEKNYSYHSLSNAEIRRQIHIQSEQKRRAQIKDGFEELRNELPACVNKKMSKVALLHRAVQHIQHLKNMQMAIITELDSLMAENKQLRKFRENVLQKQALEKMYQMNTL